MKTNTKTVQFLPIEELLNQNKYNRLFNLCLFDTFDNNIKHRLSKLPSTSFDLIKIHQIIDELLLIGLLTEESYYLKNALNGFQLEFPIILDISTYLKIRFKYFNKKIPLKLQVAIFRLYNDEYAYRKKQNQTFSNKDILTLISNKKLANFLYKNCEGDDDFDIISYSKETFPQLSPEDIFKEVKSLILEKYSKKRKYNPHKAIIHSANLYVNYSDNSNSKVSMMKKLRKEANHLKTYLNSSDLNMKYLTPYLFEMSIGSKFINVFDPLSTKDKIALNHNWLMQQYSTYAFPLGDPPKYQYRLKYYQNTKNSDLLYFHNHFSIKDSFYEYLRGLNNIAIPLESRSSVRVFIDLTDLIPEKENPNHLESKEIQTKFLELLTFVQLITSLCFANVYLVGTPRESSERCKLVSKHITIPDTMVRTKLSSEFYHYYKYPALLNTLTSTGNPITSIEYSLKNNFPRPYNSSQYYVIISNAYKNLDSFKDLINENSNVILYNLFSSEKSFVQEKQNGFHIKGINKNLIWFLYRELDVI